MTVSVNCVGFIRWLVLFKSFYRFCCQKTQTEKKEKRKKEAINAEKEETGLMSVVDKGFQSRSWKCKWRGTVGKFRLTERTDMSLFGRLWCVYHLIRRCLCFGLWRPGSLFVWSRDSKVPTSTMIMWTESESVHCSVPWLCDTSVHFLLDYVANQNCVGCIWWPVRSSQWPRLFPMELVTEGQYRLSAKKCWLTLLDVILDFWNGWLISVFIDSSV